MTTSDQGDLATEIGPDFFNREDIDPLVASAYAAMILVRSQQTDGTEKDVGLVEESYRRAVAEAVGECTILSLLQDVIVPHFAGSDITSEEILYGAIASTDNVRFNRRVEEEGTPILLLSNGVARGSNSTGETMHFNTVPVGSNYYFRQLEVPTNGFVYGRLPDTIIDVVHRGASKSTLRTGPGYMRMVYDPSMVDRRVSFASSIASFLVNQLWIAGEDSIMDYASKLAAIPINTRENPTGFPITLLETVATNGLLALKHVTDKIGVDIKADAIVKERLTFFKYVAEQWKRGKASTVERPNLYILRRYKKFQAGLPKLQRSTQKQIQSILSIAG